MEVTLPRPPLRLAYVFVDSENFMSGLDDSNRYRKWLTVLDRQLSQLVFDPGYMVVGKPKIYVRAARISRYNPLSSGKTEPKYEFVPASGDDQAIDNAIIGDVINLSSNLQNRTSCKPLLFLWSGDGDYIELLHSVHHLYEIHIVSWRDSLHGDYRHWGGITLHQFDP